MNMDYFHTTEGNPVYLKHADNFHDTRVRFKDLLPELRDIKNACTEVQILNKKCLYGGPDSGKYKMLVRRSRFWKKNVCTEVQILETGLQFLEFLFRLCI